MTGSNTFSDVPREVVLRPEVMPYDLESVNWNLAQRKEPFPKEPELSQRYVIRKLLRFGNDTNNVIALIWDQPKPSCTSILTATWI